jgi:hypothetical protein
MERRFRRAAAIVLCVLPAIAWYMYVAAHTPPGGVIGLWSWSPFKGLIERVITPTRYPFAIGVTALATVLDYAALAGIVAAIVYCATRWRRLARQPDGWIAFIFIALIASVSTQEVWGVAYAFVRGFSPLILIVWLDGFRSSSRLGATPILLTAPRIGMQLGFQITNVARELLGM